MEPSQSAEDRVVASLLDIQDESRDRQGPVVVQPEDGAPAVRLGRIRRVLAVTDEYIVYLNHEHVLHVYVDDGNTFVIPAALFSAARKIVSTPPPLLGERARAGIEYDAGYALGLALEGKAEEGTAAVQALLTERAEEVARKGRALVLQFTFLVGLLLFGLFSALLFLDGDGAGLELGSSTEFFDILILAIGGGTIGAIVAISFRGGDPIIVYPLTTRFECLQLSWMQAMLATLTSLIALLGAHAGVLGSGLVTTGWAGPLLLAIAGGYFSRWAHAILDTVRGANAPTAASQARGADREAR
ncbi:MAG: hypothetical protein AAF957_08555 [Planctomycetota bacterium]